MWTMLFILVSSIFMVISGVILFGVWRSHLLVSLLSLEYLVIGLLLMFHVSLLAYSFVFMLVYLTFTACEGALGLSILVSMSRTHGDDYFSSFHMF